MDRDHAGRERQEDDQPAEIVVEDGQQPQHRVGEPFEQRDEERDEPRLWDRQGDLAAGNLCGVK
jgi:hypothetical protein